MAYEYKRGEPAVEMVLKYFLTMFDNNDNRYIDDFNKDLKDGEFCVGQKISPGGLTTQVKLGTSTLVVSRLSSESVEDALLCYPGYKVFTTYDILSLVEYLLKVNSNLRPALLSILLKGDDPEQYAMRSIMHTPRPLPHVYALVCDLSDALP